jgi:protocatechuate 3,4-dioxygenase beta subunit
LTTGIAFLSSNVVNAFTDESPFHGYNPYSEEKTDLRTTVFGKHLSVKGVIYDELGINSLPNAKIEVWHLSPHSNKYRHRGTFKTDSFGNYEFITDYPNKEKGKCARIYFKVSKSETSYFTELSLNDYGAYISGKHWEENNQLGEKLFPKKESFLNRSTVTFNISI